jgi:hypothetical protein
VRSGRPLASPALSAIVLSLWFLSLLTASLRFVARRALALRERVHGDTHAEVSQALQRLGNAMCDTVRAPVTAYTLGDGEVCPVLQRLGNAMCDTVRAPVTAYTLGDGEVCPVLQCAPPPPRRSLRSCRDRDRREWSDPREKG